MDETGNEKLLKRVRALLAMANDPSVTEHEAANFAAKAQQMLEEHNLSLLDVSEAEKKQGIGRFTWFPKYAADSWRRMVALKAAPVYMCKIIFTEGLVDVKGRDGRIRKDWRPGFVLVGREVNTEVCRSMIDYLFVTVVRLSKEYAKDTKCGQKGRHDFERGAGIRLSVRLEEMLAASAVPASTNPGNLPALYSQELTIVDQWSAENIKQKTVSVGTHIKTDHGVFGQLAANGISLTGQVGGPSDTKKITGKD